MMVLTVEGVTAGYGDVPILTDVGITVGEKACVSACAAPWDVSSV